MRKLIRSKATKAYLTSEGTWTNDIQKAQHFAQHTEAEAAREQLGLQEIELYYSFDNLRESQYDFPPSLW